MVGMVGWSVAPDNININSQGRRAPTEGWSVAGAISKGTTMSEKILSLVEKGSLKEEKPVFDIGDTVDVHCRILEGDKERIQIFSGTVIARSGSGTREMFTVRRIVQGEGVERKFPLHSPRIAKIEVKRSGVVRRAKLYYLRQRSGKSVRLRERRADTEK
jgi:large subunit ribosomal protein L19